MPYDPNRAIYIKEKGANCPVCGGEHVKESYWISGKYGGGHKQAKIEECANCGARTTAPRKGDDT